MKLAIAIFRYFPYGGLQRDMKFIAEEAIKRGHQVTIFCGDWQGDKIPGADIRVIDAFVFFNIAGVRRFVKAFEKAFNRNEFDLLLGFNKMPGLDVYFAGDTCFAEKAHNQRGWLYRLAPRTRLYLRYENAVFNQSSKTFILSLVNSEKKAFIQHYATLEKRFYSLPPGIVADHIACVDAKIARHTLLAQLSLKTDTKILLCLGSDFRRKGVDISIVVFSKIQSSYPESALVIVGQDNPDSYRQLAADVGIADKVFFLGAMDSVGNLFHAADVFLHLAREELAGNVILESMLCACPVLVSSVCGYADYVSRYAMGEVVESLNDTSVIERQLCDLLAVNKLHWQSAANTFYSEGDAFSRIPKLFRLIEDKFDENNHADSDKTLIAQLQVESEYKNIFEFIDQINGVSVRKMPDRETIRFICGDKTYYLKRHFGVGWWEIAKNLLQLRLPVLGAINEWNALQKLSSLGIPSLQPVAYGVRGKNPARQESFIVTRELTDVVQVDHFLQSTTVTGKSRWQLIEVIAVIAREMHAAGINHRDFYLCHFMLKNSWNRIDEPEVFIIDLHRAQMRSQVPERWLMKDLAALYFSTMSLPISLRDRLRFLRCYYQQSLVDILNQEQSFLSKVEAKAKQLYKKHG